MLCTVMFVKYAKGRQRDLLTRPYRDLSAILSSVNASIESGLPD